MATVPAKRYPDFMSLFEARVNKVQKEIRQMDDLMRPYNIVREAIVSANLNNDISVRLEPNSVICTIVPVDFDVPDTFAGIVSDIGRELAHYKMHSSGEPAIRNGVWDHSYIWKLHHYFKREVYVRVIIDYPFTGTNMIEIIKEDVLIPAHTSYDYKSIWHKKPWRIENGTGE